MKRKSLDLLTGLGFNQLEAEVYVHLLAQPPSTAYKIGKQINKPTANVYKAIDSLAEKGAILVEDNKNRLCRAVSPAELMNHTEATLLEKTREAREALSSPVDLAPDENSYTIRSAPLVFEKFRSMMQNCTTIAVVDAFPKALEKVTGSITEAVARGVKVYVEAYEPVEIGGAHVVCSKIGPEAMGHWKSQQLNLVTDGQEYLVALLDTDLKKVKQAAWSNNLYMSCMLHAGRLREQTVIQGMNAVGQPGFEAEVKKILGQQQFFFNSNVPGFNRLFDRRMATNDRAHPVPKPHKCQRIKQWEK
jgi:HTH-type transcriptional regulator, sugar sensing transcriptional regulator